MRRRARNNRRQSYNHHPQTIKIPCINFTVEELTYLKKAVSLFVQVGVTRTPGTPKAIFAIDTAACLQQKLSHMIVNFGQPFVLDPNEVVILCTANWMLAAAGGDGKMSVQIGEKLTPSYKTAINKRRCN